MSRPGELRRLMKSVLRVVPCVSRRTHTSSHLLIAVLIIQAFGSLLHFKTGCVQLDRRNTDKYNPGEIFNVIGCRRYQISERTVRVLVSVPHFKFAVKHQKFLWRVWNLERNENLYMTELFGGVPVKCQKDIMEPVEERGFQESPRM